MEEALWREKWPEWELADKEIIGKGGFGKVYRVVRKDRKKEYFAAIKVIKIPESNALVQNLIKKGYGDKEISEKISEEIDVMMEFKGHNNIASIEEYFIKKNQDMYFVFIRMELLTSFNEYIGNTKITEDKIVKVGCDICNALEKIHSKGYYHRDIKPSNLLYDKNNDSFKLTDFGSARDINIDSDLTTGPMVGTDTYRPPEVEFEDVYDERADLYSLGLVLYYLANNKKRPFQKLSDESSIRKANGQRLKGEPLPPPTKASPALAEVILKACAYEPKNRFSSAREMKSALMEISAGGKSSKRKIGTFGPKKNNKPVIAALIAVLLIGGSLTAILLSGDKSDINVSDNTEYNSDSNITMFDDSYLENSPEDDTDEEYEEIEISDEDIPVIADTEEIPITENITETTTVTTTEITTTVTEPEEVVFKGGATMEEAVLILCDTEYFVNAEKIERSEYDDWYSFTTLSDFNTYSFSFEYVDNNTDAPWIYLYDENYIEIFRERLSQFNQETRYYFEPDSKYFLYITDYDPTSYSFSINSQECDGGISRESALPIELETKYSKTIEAGGTADWFKFTTTANYSVYRIYIDLIKDSSRYLRVSVFDNRGIKVNSHSQSESDYFELYLEPEKEYYLKFDFTPEYYCDSYEFSISEITCDAGLNMEEATIIEAETEYVKTMNCSFADWYVVELEQNCDYTITVHNIDTGTIISFDIHNENDRTILYSSVNTENSENKTFRLSEGTKAYIEFSPDHNIPDGTYIFEINKTGGV